MRRFLLNTLWKSSRIVHLWRQYIGKIVCIQRFYTTPVDRSIPYSFCVLLINEFKAMAMVLFLTLLCAILRYVYFVIPTNWCIWYLRSQVKVYIILAIIFKDCSR